MYARAVPRGANVGDWERTRTVIVFMCGPEAAASGLRATHYAAGRKSVSVGVMTPVVAASSTSTSVT